MAGSDWVEQAPVFRIDALEVLDLFDIKRKQGHRYSAADLAGGRAALRTQIEKLREIPPEQRSFVQKKEAEIDQKLAAHDLIRFAYRRPHSRSRQARERRLAGNSSSRSASSCRPPGCSKTTTLPR
jgi:hypothetical protein